jgi:hypothetical protein
VERDHLDAVTERRERVDQLVPGLVEVGIEFDRAPVPCDRLPQLVPGMTFQQVAILEQELRIAPTGECLLVARLGGEVVGLVTANLVALLELVPIHAGLAPSDRQHAHDPSTPASA